MNILHMKYAVEVAKLGSLNKAAESLLIAQPNISRSIKELEADLGIVIFNRSTKGMMLTPDGEEFILYAQQILKQIDDVESLYKQRLPKKQKFSLSAPRAAYISDAVAQWIAQNDTASIDLYYQETNAQQTIQQVVANDCKLGIVRCVEQDDRLLKLTLDEKNLSYELIAEFSAVLVMNQNNPLAKKDTLTQEDLSDCLEIVHADSFSSPFLLAKASKEGGTSRQSRCVFLSEQAATWELLAQHTGAVLWSPPMAQKCLDRYGLTCRPCPSLAKTCKDYLIHRKDYKLSKQDHTFITVLCQAKRAALPSEE